MEVNRGNKLPGLPDLGPLGRQQSFLLTTAWYVETPSCTAKCLNTLRGDCHSFFSEEQEQKASYLARFKRSSGIKPSEDLQGKIWEEAL